VRTSQQADRLLLDEPLNSAEPGHIVTVMALLRKLPMSAG
jgi:ABC-type enterochelin transport system ATPase subunit